VSILWQVPQIVVLTAAEILFSITGLEFAYSQVFLLVTSQILIFLFKAAPSMKSLVQALWLLTTALGNVLIVVITLVRFENMAYELLFYAGE
jgi:solute carrier family 15 oligopeptide transporter 1